MTVVLWIMLVLCALWTAIRWLPAGAEAHMPFPYMIALIRFLWVPYLLVACAAAWLSAWLPFVLAIAGAATIVLLQAPYWGRLWHQNSATGRETTRETSHDGIGDATPAPVNAAPPASAAIPSPGTTSMQHRIRVMTLNCRYGRANADDIVAAVRERNIDVLALQELSEELTKRLVEAGLADLLPYRQLGTPHDDTDNGGFNGLWSRIHPESSTAAIVSIPAAEVPGMTFTVGTDLSDGDNDGLNSYRTTVAFASAHTKSPMRGAREWSAGIRGLSAMTQLTMTQFGQADSQPLQATKPQQPHANTHDADAASATAAPLATRTARPAATSMERRKTVNRNEESTVATPISAIAVVMGDLNAVLDHPSFRELLRSGLTDASLQEAHGHTNSFPSQVPWPRIELDHVLFTNGKSDSATTSQHNVSAHDVSSFVVRDTDHLALTATLDIS